MKKRDAALLWSLGLTLLCLVYALVTPVYSGDADNYTMALIANKLLAGEGQDTYINYLNPLLCKIFEGVLLVFPMADCFTLTAIIMLLVAIGVIAYAVASIARNHYEIIGCYSVLFAIVVMGDLFHDNFTRWAAFLSAAGVILILLMLHGRLEKNRWIVMAAILLTWGLMWRYEAVLVFVPYVLLDLAVQIFFVSKSSQERKVCLKKVVKIVGIPTVCLIALGLCHYGTFQSEKYQAAKAYDDARCAVVDYPLRAWEDIKGAIPDITKNDYNGVREWLLMDIERVDTQFLVEMSEAGQESESEWSLSTIINMQKKVLGVILGSRHMLYLCGLAGVFFLTAILSKMPWYHKLQTFFIYLGTDLICLFFVYAGRAIERVFILIFYAMLISVGTLILTEMQETREKVILLAKKTIVAIGMLGVCYGLTHAGFSVEQSVFNAKNYVDIEDGGYSDEKLYIWNISAYVQTPMKRFMEAGKLMPLEYTKHNIYDGSWIYGQLYFEQLLDVIEVENPMRALLEREETYYVSFEYQRVLTYLQEHFNASTEVTYMGENEGIPVWKFFVSEEE